MKFANLLCVYCLVLLSCSGLTLLCLGSDQLFVEREGTVLQTTDGTPYRYVGMNYWYGANLGSSGPGGDRDRLRRELDELSARGTAVNAFT